MDPNEPPKQSFMRGVPCLGRGRALPPQEPALGRSRVLPATEGPRVGVARGFPPFDNSPPGRGVTMAFPQTLFGRARGMMSQLDVRDVAGRARGLLLPVPEPKVGLARGTLLTSLEPPRGLTPSTEAAAQKLTENLPTKEVDLPDKDGTLVSMMRGIGLDPLMATWGRGNIPLGRGPAGDAGNVKLQAAAADVTPSVGETEEVTGRGSSFTAQGVPMQTMAGLRRAALSPLGAGRGRAVIGLFSQSPVQSSPVVAVERQTVSSVTSTATPQESLELPASEPKNTAVKMEVERESLNKTGTKGSHIQIASNHVLTCCKNKAVYQYHVTFTPSVESMGMRFGMMKEHRTTTGEVVAFDGSILYLPVQLDEVVLKSVRQTDQEEIQIQIRMTKILPPSSDLCIPFYNVVLRRVMKMLGLKVVGRNHYNPENAVILSKHRLQVWPGYATCFKRTDGELYLSVDVSHKVLRNDTVLEVMNMLYRESKPNFRDDCVKELVGSIVITRYNNRTYRVDDIEWDKSPNDTFSLMDGTKTTFVDYYRKNYGITIKDRNQPLLVHRPKERSRPGGKQTIAGEILIVPELSFLTGIPENMKKNVKLMKDLAMQVKGGSEQHTLSIQKLLKKITTTPECVKEFDRWGLEISTEMLKLKGRTLPPENICMKSSSLATGADAGWIRQVVQNTSISSVPLNNWAVFYAERCEAEVNEMINVFHKLSGPMGIRVGQPRLVPMKNDYIDTYVKSIQAQVRSEPDMQLVVCIVTGNRDDLYSAIKKLCCVQNPIPSQVINVRTISQPQRLRSISQMILLQINGKLGGELWTVSVPLKLLMVVGVDVHHDPSKRNHSVVGFVASMNSALTRWYSRVTFQGPGQEVIDGFRECFVEALQKYYEVNHNFPEKIVVYRDGVSDGQLTTVEQYEIPQLIKCFQNIGNYEPKLVFILVQKRINTTLYACVSNTFSAPPPGTVLDHTLTKGTCVNFYLLAHSIRHGCGVPTHYICLHNTANLTVDHLQRLTFKMCHLYWNYPGTIRVPAPCKYAHRLAFLAGQYLRAQPALQLADKLFFI